MRLLDRRVLDRARRHGLATTATGSSTISSSRVVAPPTVSGLELPWSGDSSETQNAAPPTASWATTGSWASLPPTRYSSTAPNAAL